jgi:hypothetical protein
MRVNKDCVPLTVSSCPEVSLSVLATKMAVASSHRKLHQVPLISHCVVAGS